MATICLCTCVVVCLAHTIILLDYGLGSMLGAPSGGAGRTDTVRNLSRCVVAALGCCYAASVSPLLAGLGCVWWRIVGAVNLRRLEDPMPAGSLAVGGRRPLASVVFWMVSNGFRRYEGRVPGLAEPGGFQSASVAWLKCHNNLFMLYNRMLGLARRLSGSAAPAWCAR